MRLSTEGDTGTQPGPATSGEFMYLPLNQITVEEQIRHYIDTDGDAFKAFLESIRGRGVLEPVLVYRRGGQFILISGERRLAASRILGLSTIPARILENMEEKTTALSVQLAENLHRENLDPIDEAASYVRYFCMRRGELPIDQMINLFINIEIDLRRVDVPSSQAATALTVITGKTISSLRRLLSLLKLPEEIQQALRSGSLGVSQGYLLAGESDNPGLLNIFKAIMEKPVTNEKLKRLLVQARKAAAGKLPAVKDDTVAKYRRGLKNIRVSLQMQKNTLTVTQADEILADLRELTALLEQLRTAAVPVEAL